MNKKEVKNKKIKNTVKGNRVRYLILVVITGIIDALLYLLVFSSLAGMGYSIYRIIECIFAEDFCRYNEYLTNLGIYASLSLIPISSLVISFILACRTFVNEVENDLARGSNIQVQIKKLPRGAGINSARYLQEAQIFEGQACQKSCFRKTLSNYEYEIDIFYKQEISEFFILSLFDVELLNFTVDGEGKCNDKSLLLRNVRNIMDAPCVIKDNAGANADKEGEQIIIFLSNNAVNENIEDYLYGKTKTGERLIKRVLRFKMNFLKKNFSQKNKVIFPITRNLIEFFTKSSLKRRIVVAEIEFRLAEEKSFLARQTTTKSFSTINSSVKGLDIVDVSYKIHRDVSWVKYVDKRMKIIEDTLKVNS